MLTKGLGKQVIIDNKGGAGGTVGASVASRATPDGYTFFMGLAYALTGLRRQRGAVSDTSLLWPAAALGLCTLLLGTAFALTAVDQQLRVILSWYAIALGVILGFTALRLRPTTAAVGPSAGIAR